MLNVDESAKNIKLNSFESYHIDKIQEAKYCISLHLTEYKNGIEIYCNYKRNLFNPKTIERLINGYMSLLSNITENLED